MKLLVELHTMTSVERYTVDQADFQEMLDHVLKDGLFVQLIVRVLPKPFFKPDAEQEAA